MIAFGLACIHPERVIVPMRGPCWAAWRHFRKLTVIIVKGGDAHIVRRPLLTDSMTWESISGNRHCVNS